MEITKEQLLELLKENLTVEIRKGYDYGSEGVEISILFDDEVICEDYGALKYRSDY
jgi:hypothetical protein